MCVLINRIYSSIRTIQSKPIDVKSNTFNDSDKEIYDNDPEFKIDDIVRIYKYKKIFAKDYTPNWSEEVFVNKKFKNHVPWTYLTIGWRRNYWSFFKKRIAKNKSKIIYNWKSSQEKRQ